MTSVIGVVALIAVKLTRSANSTAIGCVRTWSSLAAGAHQLLDHVGREVAGQHGPLAVGVGELCLQAVALRDVAQDAGEQASLRQQEPRSPRARWAAGCRRRGSPRAPAAGRRWPTCAAEDTLDARPVGWLQIGGMISSASSHPTAASRA